ncbi:protein FAM184B isoform X3 [Centrocercus urophasianus]|uniref:protein FAM184B isoform X3 n=1 Tax=Centrocercus urophasianus TaxID=9002 RepID=UPI001C64A1F6|nr:protein FAM184B isoform X3 [Centrocercus urophasianus]
MASGINKSRQSGTCNGSEAPRGISAEGYNKEIHMQMCKKIAQLTKVIYALNTKNDEHEDSIQALREAHEEEVQHILAEMKEAILQYKSKVEEEQLLRKHIQALETAVEQHRKLKEEALAELTLCKKQVEEREPRAEVKVTHVALSTDTVDTNADFENKLTNGQQNECKLSRRDNLDEDIFAEKLSMERQVLINEMENLRSENQGAIKEYTQKTNQLRASCERGRESLKKSTQQSMTETKNLHQQREMEQRNWSEAEKGFWMQQVKKLEADLEEKSQKINERKKHSQKLKERIQELQMQLEEFKRKSECEIKQLEKEKEALTGKLQNSSLEIYTYLVPWKERYKVPCGLNANLLESCNPLLLHYKICSTTVKRLFWNYKVAQLRQILDQQADNFKESLKKHNLQSSKEKEKLLQDLQNTIKENQNVKLQLEASHQKVLKMLEKNKKQELKEAEERLKKEFNETFKIQHQSHRLEMQTLEERAKKELQDELEQIQKQQTLLLGSLRVEISEQQTSCTNLKKQIEELQMELRSVRTLKKQQEGSSQNQIRSLHDELEKCQSEISELKKENSLLKDTMELLSAELETQKQEPAQLQDKERQHKRLKKLEENTRKPESRPEDIHLISCLQDKLSEREEIIKQLVEGRKFQHSLLASTESYRNRSFSFTPNPGCLTPMKQKRPVEVPSRVVSVPNLASYAKSFLSGDLRSKRNAPQITKSTSLDQSPGCLRVGSPTAQTSDSSTSIRYLFILMWFQGISVNLYSESCRHPSTLQVWK